VDSSFKAQIKNMLRGYYVQKLQYHSSHRVKPPSQVENRLKHSLRVAFLASKLSKIFLQNNKYAVRAALLHDIGYTTVTPEFARNHHFDHSMRGFNLVQQKKEPSIIIEAIRTHMFPMGPHPRTLFSFLIWFVDKLDWIIHLTKLKGFFNKYIDQTLT